MLIKDKDDFLEIDSDFRDVLNGFPTGHHSTVGEESLSHSIPKLHDDLCA